MNQSVWSVEMNGSFTVEVLVGRTLESVRLFCSFFCVDVEWTLPRVVVEAEASHDVFDRGDFLRFSAAACWNILSLSVEEKYFRLKS